jgi:pentalenic acid synthase
MDPPDHATHRRIAAPLFSMATLARYQPQLMRIVDGCIDEMVSSGPGADLVRSLAEPIPSMFITELLGLPTHQRPGLLASSRVLIDRGAAPDEVRAASAAVREAVGATLAEREIFADGSLMGRLVTRYRKLGRYDRDQLVELVGTLVVAGHETTTSMISLSVLALLSHSDQLRALTAEPAFIPGAVDELLRFLSVADVATIRVTTRRVAIGGAVIPAGAGVIALGATANYDPKLFANPSALNIHRDARSHVAFGYGIHRCLGQNLARMELLVVLERLLNRLPNLRLSHPGHSPVVRAGATFHGIEALHVAW